MTQRALPGARSQYQIPLFDCELMEIVLNERRLCLQTCRERPIPLMVSGSIGPQRAAVTQSAVLSYMFS
jgi:hypothetical protein